MTKNKDLKRLVRTRMTKTGESYTAARAQITGTGKRPAVPKLPVEQAGMSDERVKEKTGRSWAEWVDVLDAIGAKEMSHTEIARHVSEELGVPAWWSQMVTVGYERMRGLRATHQRRGGTFEAGKSRTFPVSVSELFQAFAQKRRRDKFLPGIALKVRTSIEDKSMRITWPDTTNVELAFIGKDKSKSTLTVTHKKLASEDAVAKSKAFWAERFDMLADTLKKR